MLGGAGSSSVTGLLARMEACMRRLSSIFVVALAASCLVLMARDASASEVRKTFNMPVQVAAAIGATGCTNNPGPQITFQGEMSVAGLGIDMIFSNNAKGTHTYTDGVVEKVEAVPAGE